MLVIIIELAIFAMLIVFTVASAYNAVRAAVIWHATEDREARRLLKAVANSSFFMALDRFLASSAIYAYTDLPGAVYARATVYYLWLPVIVMHFFSYTYSSYQFWLSISPREEAPSD